MSSVIRVCPDKNGRAIIKLYGQEYDVTNLADKNSKGVFQMFGKTIEFEVRPSKTAMKRKNIMDEAKENADTDTDSEVKEEGKDEA